MVASAFFAAKVILKENNRLAHKVAAHPVVDFILGERATTAVISRVFIYSTLILPILISTILFFQKGFLRAVYESVVALVFYVIGLKTSYLDYDAIFGSKKFAAGIFVFGGYLIITTYFEGFTCFKVVFTILAFTFILFSLLLQNQSNLDMVFIRKDRNLPTIPENIRRYNGLVVLLFFISILILFNLKNIVVFALKIAGMIMEIVGWLLLKLMLLLYPIPEKSEPGQTRQQVPFFGDENTPQNPWIGLIYNVIFYLIFFYALYKLIPILHKAVMKAIVKLANFLKKLLGKLIKDSVQEVGDYYDEVEVIKPSDEEIDPRKLNKKLRSLKRDLSKITDPIEKVRYLYALVILSLKSRNLEIKSSDTTGEILCKSKKIQGLDSHMKGFTMSYNKVRYGDRIPTPAEVAAVEKDYSRALEVMKKG